MMRWLIADSESNVTEVLAVSWEGHETMSSRLYGVFAATGGGLVRYGRRTRHCVEYSFEVELNRVLDLYCGLVQAGLEMTELSHHQLTELCMLRRQECAWRRPSSIVGVHLVISFVRTGLGKETPAVVTVPVCGC